MRGVFWLIVVLCIVWWAFQDHLQDSFLYCECSECTGYPHHRGITSGVFWLIVVLCIVCWWAIQDHLRGKTTAFSIVGAQNVLGALILEGGSLTGRPHWPTRRSLCLGVCADSQNVRRNVRLLYKISYDTLFFASLAKVVCTHSWAHARIFPPHHTWDLNSM